MMNLLEGSAWKIYQSVGNEIGAVRTTNYGNIFDWILFFWGVILWDRGDRIP